MSIWDHPELWKPDDKADEDGLGPVGHTLANIGEGALHLGPDTISFLSDLGYDVSRFVGNMAKHGMAGPTPDQMFEGLKAPGEGPIGKPVNEVFRKGEEDYTGGHVPTPKNAPERVINAASRGMADAMIGGPSAAGIDALSGISGGSAAQLAQELFPGNKWLPWIAGIIGGGIPGATHGTFAVRATRAIKEGMDHPAFSELLPAVVSIEGGGSLDHPNVSPKGAMGVMQVMPDTAAHPGFGIKPWDGKSQADLARVGRDYLAVMTKKYDGDHGKILAAYNSGPGYVDGLVRKYGNDWASHLNDETSAYVKNGLEKIVEQNAPKTDLGIQPEAPQASPTDELANVIGDLPKERLAPAIKTEDGTVYTGPEGGGHLHVVENNPDVEFTNHATDGFVTPEGKFLDREEAARFINTDEPHLESTLYARGEYDPKDVLTPAEMQEMDASVSEPPSINAADDRTDQFSTDQGPPVPANDVNEGMGPNDPIFNNLTQEAPEGPPQEAPAGSGNEPSSGGDEPPSDGGEPPKKPLSPEELFTKVTDALKRAVPARAKQQKLYSEARKAKMADLIAARKATGGVGGFYAEKAQLRGELPTADYAGLTGLSQQDIEALFDHVKNHPNLGYLQSINAREGLAKMLEGRAPTRSEIRLLARTMPPELMKALLGKRSLLEQLAEHAANVLNVPKAAMASYDLSAPMRQGVLMIGRKEFFTSFGPMVKAFVSPRYQKEVFESIYRDPLFSAMQDSDLAVPVYEQHNGGPALMDHEEPYMTNLAQKIPLVGIGIRASERAYNTFVYKLRADTFKSLYNLGKAQGKIWDQDSLKDLSRFINTFTGRGDLGSLNNLAPILNSGLFSPRLLKSRIDAINVLPGGFYAKLDPFVRKEAMKSMMSFAAFATTTMGLAYLAGAEVGLDPRKADGWKIKVGNTRWDILGGIQQLVRLMGNVATFTVSNAKELATTGKIHVGYKDKTAIDSVGSFLRNKESPDLSLLHDFIAGNDAVGEDFRADKAILSRVTPMVAGDAYDAYKDLREAGAPVDKAILMGTLKASPGIIGVGATTYPPHEKKSGGGDPFASPLDSSVFEDDDLWKVPT